MHTDIGIRVIFAIDDEAERASFASLAAAQLPLFVVHFPTDIA